jgi:hypothetical protein
VTPWLAPTKRSGAWTNVYSTSETTVVTTTIGSFCRRIPNSAERSSATQ